MNKGMFKVTYQNIMDARNEVELHDIAKYLDDEHKTMDYRDLSLLQTLLLAKANSMALTNMMEVISIMQLDEAVMLDAPPYDDRH